MTYHLKDFQKSIMTDQIHKKLCEYKRDRPTQIYIHRTINLYNLREILIYNIDRIINLYKSFHKNYYFINL